MNPTQTQCEQMRAMFSSYLDGALTGAEMQSIARHMQECGECRAEYSSLAKSQRLVASLGRKPAPRDLALRLKVALSSESSAFLGMSRCALQWQIAMNNFMLPATAGLFSAVHFLRPRDRIRHRAGERHLHAPPTFRPCYSLPLNCAWLPARWNLAFPSDESIVVETLVDANGRVASYRVISAPENAQKLLTKLDNMLIFTVFKPATTFGKPTSSRVVLSFSSVNVRG